ncbi:MAG TPA: hypothetical protein VFH83_04590 [Spirochaetia bacterium]|nr:hypothetical protein [Spirochaetia bacterium]
MRPGSASARECRRKILILTMGMGSGHNVPAASVAEAIARYHPSVDAPVVDLADDARPRYGRLEKRCWRFCLRHPEILKPFYYATHRSIRFVRVLDTASRRKASSDVLDLLELERPDVILCTHYGPANIISRLRKDHPGLPPVVVLITDPFEPHALWLVEPSELYLLSALGRAEELSAAGIPAERIRNIDFPLRLCFTSDTATAWKPRPAPLQGKNAKLRVTLAAGGEGIGRLRAQVDALLKANLDLFLVVLCGRNREVREALLKLVQERRSARTTVVPVGFTDDVHGILSATDITMGKSGTSFTLESLFCGKPFLITQTLANEEGCRDFVLRNGAGWFEPTIPAQVELVRRLVTDRALLREVSRNCRALGLRNGSRQIADLLTRMARDRARFGAVPPCPGPRAAH